MVMKVHSSLVFSGVFVLSLAFNLSADEVCLTNWEVSGASHHSAYVGQDDVGFGAFCYRIDMTTTAGVMGEFCAEVDISGAITIDLHGSSYLTGKDCYLSGYVDAVPYWSNSCRFMSPEKFDARIKSVDTDFCFE
jgi:hypothetical protein